MLEWQKWVLRIWCDPQKKTRVSGVQLADSQASSFERFSQINANKKEDWGLDRLILLINERMAAIPVIAAIYVLQVMEPPMSADRGRGPNTRPLDTDWWHSNLLL